MSSRTILGRLFAALLAFSAFSASLLISTQPVEAAKKPTISKISPTKGSAKGGTTITIRGSGYTSVRRVTIGGLKAKRVKVVSSTKLKVIVPAHKAGKVSITVTTAKGKAALRGAFTYKTPKPAAPIITKLSPASGTTMGGTTLTVIGRNLSTTRKLTVDGVAATKVKIVSTSKVTAITPAHTAPGKVRLTLTTAKGTATASFTYYKALIKSGQIIAKTGQRITGRRISNPSGPCVVVPAGVSAVTITGNEIGPCGGGVNGLGVLVQERATRITISGNTIHDVSSGAHVVGSLSPIVFAYNAVYNVRGPLPRGQMIQFDSVTGTAGQSKIIGNVSDQQRATIATGYEDHISMYKSWGSSTKPILIACNRLRGSATANNLSTGYDTSNGSGIMVGDNGGGWLDLRNNVILYTPNTGIGIAGGSNITAANNLIYNRGTAAGSMTQEALTVFSYAGSVPTDITITGNRGAANAWKYGGTGQLVDGYWASAGVGKVTLSGNNFTDTTLSANIWNTTLSCP